MLKVIKAARELPTAQLERVCGGERELDYLRHEFFREEGAVCCLWLEDGACVSALRLEPWRDGLLLTGLRTVPERQNQGCARALLGAVQAFLSRQGSVKLYSHIHKRNAASIRVHEKCGFRRIADTAALLDGSVTAQLGTYLFDGT